SIRRHEPPLPVSLPAFLPNPATGAGLAVAGRAHEQHAPLGSAAVFLDAPQVDRIEIADRVPPKEIGVVRLENGWHPGGLEITPAMQRCFVEAAVILAIDGEKVEAGIVRLFIVSKTHLDKTNSFNVVKPHAEPNARMKPAVFGIPVAHQHA